LIDSRVGANWGGEKLRTLKFTGELKMKKVQFYFGFTLIELLVVISIIGMLAGLLMPAINSARESGRRATCISNQRQVAYQLVSMATTSGFPPLLKGSATDGGAHSWIVQLLPVMEEQGLFDRIKENDYSDSITTYTIPVLKCKSSATETPAGVNYIVNGGVVDGATDIDYNSVKFSAFLTSKYGAKIDDIKATTKTLVISENLDAGNWSDGLVAASIAATGDTDNVSANKIESKFAFIYPNYTGVLSDTNPTFDDTSVCFINVQASTSATSPSSYRTARPSSNHPGTVVAGFADGGVRPLNDNIAPHIYIQLLRPDISFIDAKDLGW
jgi:prepilin-type N-terminal cleavage/methylation domain-containing protein